MNQLSSKYASRVKGKAGKAFYSAVMAKVVEGKGGAVTRRFSLHQKFSNASNWMIIVSHNFVFEYDCIFGLQDFYCTIIQKLLCLIGILPRFKPISTGGGGGGEESSTYSPVNGSELQNRTSDYLETSYLFLTRY